MNSRIRLSHGESNESEHSLVYPWDARGDRISVLSAPGIALLGAKVGTRISNEGRTCVVQSIPYQPEAAGDHHL